MPLVGLMVPYWTQPNATTLTPTPGLPSPQWALVESSLGQNLSPVESTSWAEMTPITPVFALWKCSHLASTNGWLWPPYCSLGAVWGQSWWMATYTRSGATTEKDPSILWRNTTPWRTSGSIRHRCLSVGTAWERQRLWCRRPMGLQDLTEGAWMVRAMGGALAHGLVQLNEN